MNMNQWALFASIAIALASQASGQTPGTPTSATPTTADQSSLGQLDEKTTPSTIRVSELIGTNIQNPAGESLGEIEDIVIDKEGKVRYAAVTYGGFLGLGDKLFAVPFEAFQVRIDPDELDDDDIDSDDFVMVLNVTQQQLEGQQGFDQDNWPDMADPTMARELDNRYGVKRALKSTDGSSGAIEP